MKQRPRIYYTEEQKAMMWDRWQKGDTFGAIAKLFDRYHSSVEGIIAETGGIRPAPRYRSSRCLSLAEREEISRGIATGQSLRTIATSLNLPHQPSVVKLTAMVDYTNTEPVRLINRPGIVHIALKSVNWLKIDH